MTERVKVAGPDPHAPPELRTCARRDVLPGDGFWVVEDAIARGAHVQRDEKVLDNAVGRDRRKEGPSNGEEGAVGAHEHVQAALEKLEQRFVSPVELFAGCVAVARSQPELAADTADLRPPEVSHQGMNGVRLELGVRV